MREKSRADQPGTIVASLLLVLALAAVAPAATAAPAGTGPDAAAQDGPSAANATGGLAIEHAPGGTLEESGVLGQRLAVEASGERQRIAIGGNESTAVRVRDADDGQTVELVPEDGEPRRSLRTVDLHVYGEGGEITSDPWIGRQGFSNSDRVNVTVRGDRDAFADDDGFSRYVIELYDAETDETIASTGPRLVGVGLRNRVEQHGRTGDVTFTLPRPDSVESVDAQFRLETDDSRQLVPVEERDGRLVATVNATAFQTGDAHAAFAFRANASDAEPALEVRTDARIGPEPASLPYGEAVIGVPTRIEADHPRPAEVESYRWTFPDGTTTTTEQPVVEHTFDRAGDDRVELTVRRGGRTATTTGYVTLQETFDLAEESAFEDRLEPLPAGHPVTLALHDESDTLDVGAAGGLEWTITRANATTTDASETRHTSNWTLSYVFDEPGTYEVTVRGDGSNVTGTRSTTVNVTEAIEIEGRLVGPDGEPVAGDTVGAWVGRNRSISLGGHARVETDEQGRFELVLGAQPDSYGVGYWQGAPRAGSRDTHPRDGRVDRFAIAAVNGSADADLGDVELPRGHPVNLTVVDASGNPYPDRLVRHVHRPTSGLGAFSLSTTDERGVAVSGDRPGLELNGTVDLGVWDQSPSRWRSWPGTLAVDGPRDVTVGLDAGPNGSDVWIDAVANLSPTNVAVGESTTVDASDARAVVDGDETDFEAVRWSFGDGAAATGPNATHAYDEPGEYRVTATFVRGSVTATYASTVSVGAAEDDGSAGGDSVPGFGPLAALLALLAGSSALRGRSDR